MKFGQVDHPEEINFNLPEDHPGTSAILKEQGKAVKAKVYVGCAKWNKTDLKNFYPRGTKDELAYYATQFNSIELNATFYRMFGMDQMAGWASKTPEDFRFFPKVPNVISHLKRLNNVSAETAEFTENLKGFGKKLGMTFLQLHDNFKPKDMERLQTFLEAFPKEIPLALELRNREWFENERTAEELYALLEKHRVTNIIVDTAGRRDLLHMRLTTPIAFIRYVGANAPSDYTRIDDWLDRLESWMKQGIKEIYFFVHQNLEKESPMISAEFIEKLNKHFGYELKVPEVAVQ